MNRVEAFWKWVSGMNAEQRQGFGHFSLMRKQLSRSKYEPKAFEGSPAWRRRMKSEGRPA